MNTDVIEHLKKIKFVGPFPHGDTVLLVPFQNALDEAKAVDKNIAEKGLKNLFRQNNILVFSTLDDYIKYKGIKK